MTRSLHRALVGTLLPFALILITSCQDRTTGERKRTAQLPPPESGLSVEEHEAGLANTTYSSASFAEHVRISAHLDRDVFRPGDSFRIAVVFDIDDGWHIYGNPLGPGVGEETVVAAERPDGFELGPARYALAQRVEQDFGEAGKTWVWQHTAKTVHFLSGKVRGDTQPGAYQLTVETSAQVCAKQACLPGRATIQLPVTLIAADGTPHPTNAELFKGFGEAREP